MDYDCIIAGGSFAGLAAADQIKRGRVLLIDSKEPGTFPRSACGTLLPTVEELGLEESIIQIFKTIIVHIGSRKVVFNLPYPFCTIDYKKFCGVLLKRSRAEFLKTAVRGIRGDKVITDRGEFSSKCIIDASGWKAVLASSLRKDFVRKEDLSFGIETVLDYTGDSLYFWWNGFADKGVTWLFPCKGQSRIGIGSYVGRTRLKEGLEGFLKQFDLEIDGLHGGFFPHRLREPTVDNIFLAGDSAGQCLPFTGEGIRTALHFGQECGIIVQRIIDGKINRKQGLAHYRAFVRGHKGAFRHMEKGQKFLISIPNFWVWFFSGLLSRQIIFRWLMRKYRDLARLVQWEENSSD
ncbi:MAG: NAD(P)/FAD-dependent oxidoreductase [Nitrospirae bacterium]|nr:NAD(P)/FAD-dependent oxidoreductase [Nitrospirota bacterium]